MIIVYRINWFRIIDDLNKADVSDARIAEEIDVSPSQVSAYKAGKQDPSHTNGEKLLALHRMRVLSPETPKTEPRMA